MVEPDRDPRLDPLDDPRLDRSTMDGLCRLQQAERKNIRQMSEATCLPLLVQPLQGHSNKLSLTGLTMILIPSSVDEAKWQTEPTAVRQRRAINVKRSQKYDL